jgi:hypothetical protein
MLGLLTFVSTSCKKNQENGEMTVTVSLPSLDNVGDRAYIATNGQFWWLENDYIRVYNLAEETNASQSKTSVFSKIGNEVAQSARFRGPSVGAKKAEGFRIFYPVNMIAGTTEEVNADLANENRQTFVVSDHQVFSSYTTGDHHYSMVDAYAMPMAEKMNKLTDAATLHHIFGVAAFNLNSGDEQGVVVDSVLYQDKGFNITGQVSMKLHKVATDDSQGENHNLNRVWEAYEGFTPEYVANTLAPELEWLGYDPDYTTLGDHIMMDCVYEHEDGTVAGVTLNQAPYATNFNFMLRPLAVSQGFNLTLYVHNDADPENPIVVELDEADFEYGIGACDYTWAAKPGKRKTYIKSFGIFE